MQKHNFWWPSSITLQWAVLVSLHTRLQGSHVDVTDGMKF
jgi:hypothetical protein